MDAKLGRGIDMIAAERLRQIKKHGYGAAHDDGHANGELTEAAVAYISPVWPEGSGSFAKDGAPENWPFEAESYKQGMVDTERLAKAGAMIAAEIDRLLRLQAMGRRPSDDMELSQRVDLVCARASSAMDFPCADENGAFAVQVLGEAVGVIRDLKRCAENLGEAVAEMFMARGKMSGGPTELVGKKMAKALKRQQQDPDSGDGY